MISRRDNLRRVLKGETPAWVPFTMNFHQWFTHHQQNDSLPAELRGCHDSIDALHVLDADIFSRNVNGGVHQHYDGIEPEVETTEGQQGPRKTTKWHTPHGTLRSVSETQTRLSTQYQAEDLIKDWDREAKAYRWLLERMVCGWDRTVFETNNRRIGDQGLLMIQAGCTPLKLLHRHFGLDGSSFFIMDYPDQAQAICDLYWSKLWPVLQTLATDDAVDAVILMDNVDTPFYPPSFAQRFWTPYVRQAVDLFEPAGKVVFVHACGQLRGLSAVFRESGVHGLEGMAHPPLGDITVADIKQIHDRFIYNGGFSAHEQVVKPDDEVRRFYAQLFRELDGWPRFIFAAACQTAIDTPWERIKLARDCCREHGGDRV